MKGAFPCKAMGNICSVWWAKPTRRRSVPKTVGMSVPYFPEYLGLDINYSFAQSACRTYGWQVLRPDAVEDAAQMLFTTPAQNISTLQDYWPWFVVLALCLLVSEIAIDHPYSHRLDHPAPAPGICQRRPLRMPIELRPLCIAVPKNGVGVPRCPRDGHSASEASTDQSLAFLSCRFAGSATNPETCYVYCAYSVPRSAL